MPVLIKGIEFPEELLRAQSAGELVVFAGAGVSCPPPSSLPLFGPLAEQIGRYSGIVREDLERKERYLGRLRERLINVHEASSEILLNPESKPHELHRLLLELFPSPKGVRLVTTNFEKHFSTAAEAYLSQKSRLFTDPLFRLDTTLMGLFICRLKTV
jgi:hypothetical protein